MLTTFRTALAGPALSAATSRTPSARSASETNGTTLDTEMIQLDINGGTLPPGVMIRESPTLASTGQETATPESGGMFHIDSFFDIFTELSLDGGQTWTPSSGPSHENIGPSNPTANRASTWGKLKTIYR